MLLQSRVASRTLGLRGPDLARGPEVARPCPRPLIGLGPCYIGSIYNVGEANLIYA